ncbi:hypothetical protein GTW43_36260 [Streptomyces sp. SID5785]|uniref:hypothetical protein n=1 Tax=Streptomyces sp. SID5785 TaxID=2690309 RepID=UPI001360BD78|nr:hypothetical protein [Streptomyces sp. SID5785]MZD10492.1 hypothetical protein [Streptomyces sp. SID5785]
MTDAAHSSWPTVDLDPVRRLKIIASATKQPGFAERHFGAGFELLWSVASDLEHELPQIIPGLRSFTVISSDGDRLSGRAVGVLGHREHFDVVLRPGWCLMQSRVLTSGMAAMPEGDGSRFAFFAAVRLPGGAALGRMRRAGSVQRQERLLDRLQERVELRSAPDATD